MGQKTEIRDLIVSRQYSGGRFRTKEGIEAFNKMRECMNKGGTVVMKTKFEGTDELLSMDLNWP